MTTQIPFPNCDIQKMKKFKTLPWHNREGLSLYLTRATSENGAHVAGCIASKCQGWILMLLFLLRCAKGCVSWTAAFGNGLCLRTKASILTCRCLFLLPTAVLTFFLFFYIALEHPCADGSEMKACVRIIPIPITTAQILKPKSSSQRALTSLT